MKHNYTGVSRTTAHGVMSYENGLYTWTNDGADYSIFFFSETTGIDKYININIDELVEFTNITVTGEVTFRLNKDSNFTVLNTRQLESSYLRFINKGEQIIVETDKEEFVVETTESAQRTLQIRIEKNAKITFTKLYHY